MLLAVDVGNTNIKYALFEGDEIVTSFRVKTDTTKTSDELGLSLINLLKSKGYKPEVINAVIISSVVPYIMHALNNAVLKFFEIPPMIVGPGMKTGIKLVS